jgi:beta-xylosidase
MRGDCGLCAPELGQALDDMQWHTLFVDERAAWGQHISVHTLGHAIFEVGLQPHLGWCGKALLLDVDTGFFSCHEPHSASSWMTGWLAAGR